MAPPLYFADDAEVSIFPRECSKFWFTKIPPAAWRQNLVSRLQLQLRWSENIGKIELHNGPHYIPKSADIAIARRTTTTNIKTWTNWQTSFVANIDGKLWKSMEISSILFDFQTLELISQSPQPSQNPAKDPRGTPEHGTSILLRQRPWNCYVSSQVFEVVVHINRTCGVEAELGIKIPTETALVWKYWKNKTAERATCKSQKVFNHSQGLPYLFNPVHPLIQ